MPRLPTGVYKRGEKFACRPKMKDGSRPEHIFETADEAVAKREELLRERRAGTYIPKQSILTFNQTADSWFKFFLDELKEKNAGRRPETLNQYEDHINHLKRRFNGVKMDQFNGPSGFLLWQKAKEIMLKPKAEGGHGLGGKTVNNKIEATMNRILRHGHQIGAGNQIEKFSKPEQPKHNAGLQDADGNLITNSYSKFRRIEEKEVLQPAEIKRFMLAVKEGLPRMIVGTMLYSNLRISEALGLWRDEVDEEGWVSVNRKLSTARYPGEKKTVIRFFDPKDVRGNKPNRAKRKTPIIDDTFLERLLEWKAKQPGKFLFSKEDGTPYTDRRAIDTAIKAALKQAVIDRHITPHCMRHTWVSLMIAMKRPNGTSAFDVAEISRYCGHADIMITLQKYHHFFKQREKEKNPTKGLLKNLVAEME